MLKTDDLQLTLSQKRQYTGALVTLSLATLISSLAISSINIILPELVTSLHESYQNIQWVIIAYLVFLTATLVIAGRLSDLYGRSRLFRIGVVIFTLSAGLCGMTQNLWLLTCARAVQGVGGAILIATTMALVSDIFDANRIGAAMGTIGSMSAIGTGLGPVLGGLIIVYFKWQAVFLINIPFGVFVYILAEKYLPMDFKKPNPVSASFDYSGAILLFLSILTYTLTLKLFGSRLEMYNGFLLGFMILCCASFILVVRRSLTPLINLSMFNRYDFVSSLLSNLIVATVVMASLVIGPFYLSVALGLSAAQTGFVMSASPLTVAITSNIVGRNMHRYNLSKIIICGLFAIILGAIQMSFLTVSAGLGGYFFGLIIMAIGYATFLSVNNTLTMSKALPNERGSVAGMLNLARNIGLLTGSSLISRIFASVSQLTDLTTAKIFLVESGLHAAYRFAVVLLSLAIALQVYGIAKNRK